MQSSSTGLKALAILGVPAISFKIWHSGDEMLRWKWQDPADILLGITLILGLGFTVYDLIHWSRHFPLRGIVRFGLIGGMIASGYLLLLSFFTFFSGEFRFPLLGFLAIAMLGTAVLGAFDNWLTPATVDQSVLPVKKPEPPAQQDWITIENAKRTEEEYIAFRKQRDEELAKLREQSGRTPWNRLRFSYRANPREI